MLPTWKGLLSPELPINSPSPLFSKTLLDSLCVCVCPKGSQASRPLRCSVLRDAPFCHSVEAMGTELRLGAGGLSSLRGLLSRNHWRSQKRQDTCSCRSEACVCPSKHSACLLLARAWRGAGFKLCGCHCAWASGSRVSTGSLRSGFQGEPCRPGHPRPIVTWFCILAKTLVLETTNLSSHGNADF